MDRQKPQVRGGSAPAPVAGPRLAPVDPTRPRPFWTVLIPIYNRLNFLQQCLESVLSRDPGPEVMEILIEDDHSTIEILPSVRAWAGDRVQYHRNETNLGLYKNVNAALARTIGHWIHVLHDDDYVLPGFYRIMREGIQDLPETVGVACCHYANLIASAGTTWSPQAFREGAGIFDKCLGALTIQNFLQNPAVVTRRRTFESIGTYCEDLPYTADWEFFIRSAVHYQWWYQPEDLARYRIHGDSLTQRLLHSGGMAADVRKMFERVATYVPAEVARRSLPRGRQIHARKFIDWAGQALQIGQADLALILVRQGIALHLPMVVEPEFLQLLQRPTAGPLRDWVMDAWTKLVRPTL